MQLNIANHDGMIIWDGVYYFVLSNYPHIMPWELKKALVFIDYEKQHGRQTELVCENADVLAAVNNAIDNPETAGNALLPDKITECTACKQHGCLTKFVCHTATLENARKILSSGKLLSAVKAFGKTADELVLDKRNAAGDPADYFDYIMFGWGNCVGGDRLSMERTLGRFPDENDLSVGFTPGVRFYFRYENIIKHPGYVFDGYHPVKIKDELILSAYLYVCTAPEQYKNELDKLIHPDIIDKIHYIAQNGLGMWDWAEKVYQFVERIENQ